MRLHKKNCLKGVLCLLLLISNPLLAAPLPPENKQQVDQLDKPLYTPFIERYILDELKQVRIDMQEQRAELIEKVVEKELSVADKAMRYATDTVTYFFYLIVGASSLLVLVGWTSMRDIKKNVKSYATQEVGRITLRYEKRLQILEDELRQKSRKISQTQEEIDRTNEVHSLWLKASQESNPQNKIALYDQILQVRPEDTEALTYKADVVLLMNEPQWAINLCDKALAIDNENAHAFYQRACARASLEDYEAALEDLRLAISLAAAFKEDAKNDESFNSLRDDERFINLVAA